VGIKAGASVHLITDEVSRNPRQLAKFVAERDISIWYSTPSALSLLAQYGRLDRLDYRGPRIGLFAGEVFPVKHLRSMTRLWPESQWYNLYGPTETNVCTYFRIPLPVPAERVEPYPIGTPCAHCEALVLGESGSPGAEGLLLIRGDSVFQGYWNRPEETAKAFRDIEGQRWYNTGDVVRPDEDGNLGFHGRRDRMVKRRGYRIELGEVESALYRHPSLDKIGVVALSEDTGVRIVACYSPSGACPSIVELKQFASQILPSYMVPDAFACFDQLPSTSTGKVDYQRLMDCITHGGTEES
jgi:acyl-coenzyme A synthetase/AMP-(fatty) acid ligase